MADRSDPDDSSPLLLGFATSAIEAAVPNLREWGVRIERVEPIHDANGDIRAMRFHMGSGTYLCTVVKETPGESH